MIFKFRIRHTGQHVRAKCFVGHMEGSLALTGELVMRTYEWNAFIGGLGTGLQNNEDKVIVVVEEPK
jgi:hypothetical protein